LAGRQQLILEYCRELEEERARSFHIQHDGMSGRRGKKHTWIHNLFQMLLNCFSFSFEGGWKKKFLKVHFHQTAIQDFCFSIAFSRLIAHADFIIQMLQHIPVGIQRITESARNLYYCIWMNVWKTEKAMERSTKFPNGPVVQMPSKLSTDSEFEARNILWRWQTNKQVAAKLWLLVDCVWFRALKHAHVYKYLAIGSFRIQSFIG
jgi:hypothetical protein